jgi:copper resistance protein D
MYQLYLLSVWLHILAATAWIGGMFFLVLVVVPWLRRRQLDPSMAASFLRETGARFRMVGWICFAILLGTGTFNLWMRGVRWPNLVNPEWLTSPFGKAVMAKLLLFAVVLALSAYHDFSVGPRAVVAMDRDAHSPEARRLRRRASLLGRINGLLALALVSVAVVLVRGWPW